MSFEIKAMSNFSYINILKREAKHLAAESGVKRSEALSLVARRSGFSDVHELITVAKKSPRELRLMRAALGTDDFTEVVYQDDVFRLLYDEVEEALSSAIADTNTMGFEIENLEVKDADFEEKTGVLFIELLFDYTGEQDPDRAYHGAVFHVKATLMLARRDGGWSISEPYGLEIHDVERDVDRAHRQDDYEQEWHIERGKGA